MLVAGPLASLRLLAVVAATPALQGAVQGIPVLAGVFGIPPLPWQAWPVAAGLGLVPVSAVETYKLVTGAWRAAPRGVVSRWNARAPVPPRAGRGDAASQPFVAACLV